MTDPLQAALEQAYNDSKVILAKRDYTALLTRALAELECVRERHGGEDTLYSLIDDIKQVLGYSAT